MLLYITLIGDFLAVDSVSMNVPFASSERAKMLLLKPSKQSPSQGKLSYFSTSHYTSCLLRD